MDQITEITIFPLQLELSVGVTSYNAWLHWKNTAHYKNILCYNFIYPIDLPNFDDVCYIYPSQEILDCIEYTYAYLKELPVMLKKISNWINATNGRTLVIFLCGAGMSRSVCACAVYIAITKDIEFDKSLSLIREKRPWILPLDSFVETCRAFCSMKPRQSCITLS